jgi:hypothetical protein
MGTMELEEGEEGSGGGGRLIKTVDFAEEERGRKIQGSRASRRRRTKIAHARTERAWLGRNEP